MSSGKSYHARELAWAWLQRSLAFELADVIQLRDWNNCPQATATESFSTLHLSPHLDSKVSSLSEASLIEAFESLQSSTQTRPPLNTTAAERSPNRHHEAGRLFYERMELCCGFGLRHDHPFDSG